MGYGLGRGAFWTGAVRLKYFEVGEMPMSQAPVSQTVPIPEQKSILFGWWPKIGKREKWARSGAAIIVWSYLILNTFVFDVDQEIKAHLPVSLGSGLID
jgi:hypothetical protein